MTTSISILLWLFFSKLIKSNSSSVFWFFGLWAFVMAGMWLDFKLIENLAGVNLGKPK